MRIAIVGCGKIADQHIQAIQRIPGCRVVAVCDRELRMACQFAERFRIDETFSELTQMLRTMSPDVVHVTTPPQSHSAIGAECLMAGSHVYVEKPFTVTANEAQALTRLAAERGLKITAGHNYQFTPEMLRMRTLVRNGFLGGLPVHLESHWSYDLGDSSYVLPILGSPDHWVRRLPGRLLHNLLSHGVARLAEFLDDEIVEVKATAHQSAALGQRGGQDVLDELRVLLRDRRGVTAFLCFSTQMQPARNQFYIAGPLNSISVDLSSGTLLTRNSRQYKSYLTFIVPPLIDARSHWTNAWRNATAILRRRLYHDAGMKELIEQFYRSIRGEGEVPIEPRQIVLTARIMDEIFRTIYADTNEPAMVARAQP